MATAARRACEARGTGAKTAAVGGAPKVPTPLWALGAAASASAHDLGDNKNY